jgi:ATPase
MVNTYDKIVPDTSVLIEGLLSKQLTKDLRVQSIIIHEASVAELEHQANEGKTTGIIGLEEIEALKTLLKDALGFSGERPKPSLIQYAKLGEN